MIVADTETRSDFELRKSRQRGLVGPHRVIGDGHAADLRDRIRRQPLQIGGGFSHMQHELVGKAVYENRPDRSVNQEVDLFR